MKARVLLTLAALGGACDKPAPPAEPPAPAPATAAQTPESAAQAPDDPAEDWATFTDAQWCPAAHADTVKIVEAMKATMKHAGRETEGDDAYAPPEQTRYVELCSKLPLEMQKCLVVGYAARNRDACEAALGKLDEAQRAAYGELMGK